MPETPIQDTLRSAGSPGTPQNPRSNPSQTGSTTGVTGAGTPTTITAQASATSGTEDKSAAASAAEALVASITNSQNKNPGIRPNQLSSLASYNYIIDLYATDTIRAKRTFDEEKFFPEDWYRIVSTVGGLQGARPGPRLQNTEDRKLPPLPNEQIARQYFTREYYIDDLELKTTVSNEPRPVDSNISFRLTEPYGISFIQEYYNFVTEVLKMDNYTETPLMLVISFKGWDDAGNLIELDNMKKYIPVQLVSAEIKLTSSGSEYHWTLSYYNRLGDEKSYGMLNCPAELEGKTLAELLINDPASDNRNNLEFILNHYQETTLEQIRVEKDTPLNPHIYKIVIEDLDGVGVDIAKSQLITAKDNPTKDTVMNKPNRASSGEKEMLKQMNQYQVLEGVRSTEKIEFEKSKVNYNKGGSVASVIELLIKNSTFATDQFVKFRDAVVAAANEKDDKKRAELFKELNQPLKWFKIITKVEPTGNFNRILNVEQKKITYYIKPVLITDTRGSAGTYAPAGDPSEWVVKEYYYFFTGKNTEIINLGIDLNLQSFVYTPGNPNTAKEATGQAPGDDEKQPEGSTAASAKTSKSTGTKQSPLQSGVKYAPVPGGGKNSPGVGNNTTERLYSRSVADSIYDINSAATLTTINMEIMGDPDLIKQDGVFYVITKPADDAMGIPSESHERFVRLNFQSPIDINTSTGLPEGLHDKETLFNGYYRFSWVESHFKQGKFTQNIQLGKATKDPTDDEKTKQSEVQATDNSSSNSKTPSDPKRGN